MAADKVVYARAGNTATLTVTIDVTDLVASPLSSDAKVQEIMNRGHTVLGNQFTGQSPAALNAQIAALQAQLAVLPVKIPAF